MIPFVVYDALIESQTHTHKHTVHKQNSNYILFLNIEKKEA